MRLGSKEAFCLSLGHTCHSGNTYAAENSYKWDQDTGGEKHGYYAKIIRWYVLNGKRTQKSFVMRQALIWSVSEGRNSEAQLKAVIKNIAKGIEHSNKQPSITAVKPPITNKITIIVLSI